MIDINIIRTNRKLVEENLKKKYQENKLPILDEIIELDKKVRELKQTGDDLRKEKNKLSKNFNKIIPTPAFFIPCAE